ncbi:MAG: hypothetical protein AAF226_01705, partial [Verrucomicrobiota bacterium]
FLSTGLGSPLVAAVLDGVADDPDALSDADAAAGLRLTGMARHRRRCHNRTRGWIFAVQDLGHQSLSIMFLI